MRAGAGLSTCPDAGTAAAGATTTALDELGGGAVDLAVVFASAQHAPRAEDLLGAVHERAVPGAAIGCVAEAVLSGGREVEDEPAVSVWLGSFPGDGETGADSPETFHMQFARTPSGGAFAGYRFDAGSGAGS